MGGWLSSIFTGSSPQLNSLISQTGQIGKQQTGQGQTNQTTASNFWDAIVSGDSTKQMQALAPEVSALKTATAQDNKGLAIFGTRGGGTGAATAASNDKTHGDIVNLLGSLTNSSASNLANLGSTQVSEGQTSLSQEQSAIAQRMQAWQNSILGKGITSAASFGESYGLSKLPGASNINQNNPNNPNSIFAPSSYDVYSSQSSSGDDQD